MAYRTFFRAFMPGVSRSDHFLSVQQRTASGHIFYVGSLADYGAFRRQGWRPAFEN